jgi:Outer membrane protein transport protein (OMPP1/FadL/TodX).
MKNKKNSLLTTCLFLVACIQNIYAQGYNTPLTMQGLNNTTNVSATSRAMGGITLSLKNDVSVMFANPAALQTLEGIQVSIGGLQQYRTDNQTQQWFTNPNYSMFSLLMAGLTHLVPDPDSASLANLNRPLDTRDTVQRPFDSIGPNWEHKKNETLPIQALIAAPFSLGGMKFAAGLGVVEYALTNYYYQNNNVLSPDIGSIRDTIIKRPTVDDIAFAIPVYWYQTTRYRNGSIYGYGASLSMAVSEKLSIGLSAMILKGSSQDDEWVVGRGVLYFYKSYLGLYPHQLDTTKVGTSDYKGSEFTVSGSYHGQSFSFGFALKMPTTITRDYKGTVRIDTAGTTLNSYSVSGTDKMKLPLRGTIGIGVMLRQNVSLSVEYEYLPNSTATLSQGSTSSQPWLDGSAFRIGFEYLPISKLALRCGYSSQKEVFEPEGNYNTGEPVTSDTYSFGIGYELNDNIRLNVAYEYEKFQYEDKWTTNYNSNSDVRQNIVAGISYTIQ